MGHVGSFGVAVNECCSFRVCAATHSFIQRLPVKCGRLTKVQLLHTSFNPRLHTADDVGLWTPLLIKGESNRAEAHIRNEMGSGFNLLRSPLCPCC